MNQRGFISSLYLYAIMAVVVLGMGYGLYYQIQKNGELSAKLEVQQASLAEANRLRTMAEEAVKERDQSLTQTRVEINRYRANLKALEARYATLLNTLLPDEFIAGMCQLTGSRNGTCLPVQNTAPKPPNS